MLTKAQNNIPYISTQGGGIRGVGGGGGNSSADDNFSDDYNMPTHVQSQPTDRNSNNNNDLFMSQSPMLRKSSVQMRKKHVFKTIDRSSVASIEYQLPVNSNSNQIGQSSTTPKIQNSKQPPKIHTSQDQQDSSLQQHNQQLVSSKQPQVPQQSHNFQEKVPIRAGIRSSPSIQLQNQGFHNPLSASISSQTRLKVIPVTTVVTTSTNQQKQDKQGHLSAVQIHNESSNVPAIEGDQSKVTSLTHCNQIEEILSQNTMNKTKKQSTINLQTPQSIPSSQVVTQSEKAMNTTFTQIINIAPAHSANGVIGSKPNRPMRQVSIKFNEDAQKISPNKQSTELDSVYYLPTQTGNQQDNLVTEIEQAASMLHSSSSLQNQLTSPVRKSKFHQEFFENLEELDQNPQGYLLQLKNQKSQQQPFLPQIQPQQQQPQQKLVLNKMLTQSKRGSPGFFSGISLHRISTEPTQTDSSNLLDAIPLDSLPSLDKHLNSSGSHKFIKAKNAIITIQRLTNQHARTISSVDELEDDLRSYKQNSIQKNIQPFNATIDQNNNHNQADYNNHGQPVFSKTYQEAFDSIHRRERLCKLCERGSLSDVEEIKSILDKDPKRYLRGSKDPAHLMNQRNAQGYTPLYIACKNGNLKVVELFVKAKCDFMLTCSVQGLKESPLEVALRWEYQDIVTYLLNSCKFEDSYLQACLDISGLRPEFKAQLNAKITKRSSACSIF